MSTNAQTVHATQVALSDVNPVKLSLLFSATAFIPPDEREEYEDFCADYLRDLTPKTAVEDTLADEIIQAAWRLHRCTIVEQQEIPPDADPEQLECLQASIDRARATAFITNR